MYAWREHRIKQRKRKLTALAVVMAGLLVFALVSWWWITLRAPTVQEASARTRLNDLATDELYRRLTYRAPHDIDILDELISRADALALADKLITSRIEKERYLSLTLYTKVPTRQQKTLREDQFQSIAGNLQHPSPAIRSYAAAALVLNNNYAGVPYLLDSLISSVPLSFMEPMLTQGEFAQTLLTFIFSADITYDPVNPARSQLDWQVWWQQNRDRFLGAST